MRVKQGAYQKREKVSRDPHWDKDWKEKLFQNITCKKLIIWIFYYFLHTFYPLNLWIPYAGYAGGRINILKQESIPVA